MNKYLDKQCLRCGEKKLLPWDMHGNKRLSLCDGCKKYIGVKLYAHQDRSQGYCLYIHGGAARRKTKRWSGHLALEYCGMTGSEINAALDRAVKAGIITL